MQPIENPHAEPLSISDREFDQYAERGYRVSEADGRRIVHVPSAIYDARMERERADMRKKAAQRQTKERHRKRERSKQRRLAKA